MWKHANLNRRYRLVWNRVRQCWSVAPEIASGQGKAAAGVSEPVQAACILPLRALVVAIGCAFSLPALALDASALPTGGSVVAGQATIGQQGSTLTVNQTTDRAILEWQSFNIGKDAAVHFNQNSASSVALNRVTGGTRSEIYGSLTANGQVYLVNSAGVLFGSTAQVDVGGIVASTLDISNDDFLAGKNRFVQGSGSGEVINQGSITAHDGGTVALIGSSVSNTGQIVANGGNVALAAGQQVTFAAGANGHLQIAVDASEAQMMVNNGGLIQADGGQVILTAQGANALASAVVSNTGTIQARTVAEREGKILLLADFDSGTSQVAGTLDASAPDGGNGGFIETSAAHVTVAESTKVTTKAASGQTGTWLIDPNDFTVAASGGDMSGATVAANLANTNFTIETATMGTAGGNGDIHINDAINWSADTTLTLNAERNINVNAAITATGSNAGLALNYGGTNGNSSSTPVSGSDYNVKAPITLNGSNASLAINGNAYTLIHSMAQLDALDAAGTGVSGYYALAQDLDASGTTYGQALVGTSNSNAFTGTFAGLGHTINNLTIDAGGTDYVGLFGYTGSNSVIRDIGMVGGSIKGNTYVGALSGYNVGSISNAYATGSVAGNDTVGGLVGFNYNGSISNAYATGSVTGTGGYVGGLVGTNYAGSIGNVYATGNVTGIGDFVGGLVGYNTGSVGNAYASGSVSGSSYVGGLVGYNYNGSISNAYWDRDSSGQSNAIGGGSGTATQISSSNRYNPNAYGNLGTWSLVAGATNVYAASDANGVQWIMIEGQTRPFLASEYSTTIGNAHQLQLMAYDLAASYTLVRDIDASATAGSNASGMWSTAGFVSVGDESNPFTGQLDGQSHTIGDLLINRSSTNYVGLFGYTGSGSVIRNIGLVGGGVLGQYYVGGLIGWSNDSTISNAYTTGSVSGNGSVGGLIGWNQGSTISNVYSTGSVSGISQYTGGLVGVVNGGSINNAYAAGRVSGGNQYSGGLVGFNSGGSTISNAYATGSVTGGFQVGGLVGENNGTVTSSFYATTDAQGNVINNGGGATGVFTGNALGTGKSWVELTQLSTFSNAGWDIDDAGGTGLVWRIYEGYTTPLLRSFLKSVTATAAINQSKTYDGTTTGTVSYTTSLVDAVLDGSVGYTTQSKNVGVYSSSNSSLSLTNGLYSSQEGYDIAYVETNSDVTIDKASITVSSSDVIKTYDGTTNAAGSAAVTLGTLFGSDSLSGGSFAFTDINAGTGKTVSTSGVTVSDGNNGGNYDVTYADNMSSTIDKASITVSTSDVSKTYDGTTSAAGSAVLIGGTLFNSDSLSGGVFAFTDANAGTGKTVTADGVTVSDGNNGGNYDVTYVDNTSSTIDKASITVTANGGTSTYGDNGLLNPGLTAAGLVNGEDESVLTGLANSFGIDNSTNAGSYTLTVDGTLSNGNYVVTQTSDGTWVVDRKTLTVKASDDRRSVSNQAYSGGNGVTYQGFVNGEGLGVLNGSLSYGGTAQGATQAGTYALSVSGLSGDNYAIQYVDGRLLLTAPLTTPGGGELVRPVRDSLRNQPSGLPLALASSEGLRLTILGDPMGMAD
ncbi:MAG: GLUG motif-containing protein [Pseudomonas sp.]|uniref:two-partner secretion domain-containing protein n=1 Tax=Pseudomonas sp. TaxID=306 RepID=UPI00398195F6